MDNKKLYIGALGSAFLATIIWLFILQEQRISIYFSFISIAFYIITLILMPKTRTYGFIGFGLFCIFVYFIIMHIFNLIDIL